MTKTVTRYSFNEFGWPVPTENGAYVEYETVKHLLQDEPAAPLVLGERAEAVKLLRASWAACIDGEPDKALADNIHEFLERLAANRGGES